MMMMSKFLDWLLGKPEVTNYHLSSAGLPTHTITALYGPREIIKVSRAGNLFMIVDSDGVILKVERTMEDALFWVNQRYIRA